MRIFLRPLAAILTFAAGMGAALYSTVTSDRPAPLPKAGPVPVDFCEIVRDPGTFDVRLVQVQAWTHTGESDPMLYDAGVGERRCPTPIRVMCDSPRCQWIFGRPEEKRKIDLDVFLTGALYRNGGAPGIPLLVVTQVIALREYEGRGRGSGHGSGDGDGPGGSY
jgi:hypothetical protein